MTVILNPRSPALTVVGEIVVIVGLTARLTALEVPPPGAGLKTVIGKVPAEAMSAARIVAVNCVALTNVVVRAIPLMRTAEPPTKFVPFTVRAKSIPPAVTLVGAIVVIAGRGTVETVKLTTLELKPVGPTPIVPSGVNTPVNGADPEPIAVPG